MPEAAIEAYRSTLIERVLALTQTTPMDGLVQRCQDGKELRFAFFNLNAMRSGSGAYIVVPYSMTLWDKGRDVLIFFVLTVLSFSSIIQKRL